MTSVPIPSSTSRLAFIDYLRGIAVLWMIEVHVVDVCLSTYLKQGFFYNNLNISNGFVAVAFIFCAGAGFQLAFAKKGEEYRKLSASLWIYLRRLGHILLLAYWLHLPAFSLQRTLQASREEWIRFFDCDVLQTIVFSSLISLCISLIIRNARLRVAIFICGIVVCFFGTIAVWGTDTFASFPMMIASMFARFPFSKFPLVPFSGYFFLGVVVMSAFSSSENKDRFARWTFIGSLLTVFLVLVVKDSSFDLPGSYDWWHVSAGHALYRAGVVVSTLFAVYMLRGYLDGTRVGRALVLCGQESLFVYIFHLMLVYGTVSNFGLQTLAPHKLGVGETFSVFLVVSALSYSLALMWHNYKKSEPSKASRLILILMISFLVIFALVPSYLADR